MTTTTGAPPPQTPGSNAATKPSNGSPPGSRPAEGHRSGTNLFANLLGLIGAAHSAPAAADAAPQETRDPKGSAADDDDTEAIGTAPADLNPNPLTDLIGWAGAAVSAPAASGPASDGAHNPRVGGGRAAGGHATSGLPADAGTLKTDGSAGNATAMQGMTVLAQPTVADASLVAQLKAGAPHAANAHPMANATANGQSPTPPADAALANGTSVSIERSSEPGSPHAAAASRAHALAASRPANWRSTATMGPSGPAGHAPAGTATSNNPATTTLLQTAQAQPDLRGREMAAGGPSLRSTVALDERFSNTVSTEAFLPASAPGRSSSRSSGQQSGTSAQGEAAFGATLANEVNDADGADPVFSLAAEHLPEDQVDPNESLSLGQLRHANVRVGEGSEEAIDIRLSLDGDAVNVHFRTDNAEVLAGLQHNANGSLSEMMQRSGLQLSGVSIGDPSQQPSGQPSGQSPSNGDQPPGRAPAGVAGGRDSTAPATERRPVARRADGGPALDVFA